MTREKTQQRRRKLSALRGSLARQEAIFSSPLIGILTLNESGSIESLNGAAERMFGGTADALVRRNFGCLVDFGGVDDIATAARLRQLATQDGEHRELVGRRRDGSTFPIDFALAEVPLGRRRIFVVFVRDNSKRKRNERVKDEFVATVSHELRTPLTSIAGSLGLLIGGAAGPLPPGAARLLKIAYSNSQRLVRLINDILDIEKIESGRATFDLKPVDLRALVEQAIEANRGFADGFGVRMRLDPHPASAVVRADADRIIQIVTNLLSNAIKFSPVGEEVVVAVEHRGAVARVCVCDRGPGIPDSFKSRIFEKFAQAETSGVRQKGGTGLGLNIVKQIVDHHGGTVGFEPAPGGGTVFYFELPCVAERALCAAAAEPMPAGPGTAARPRILHVDDDRDILHVVAEALRADAEVISASSIKEARRALADGGVDLAVIDLVLADGGRARSPLGAAQGRRQGHPRDRVLRAGPHSRARPARRCRPHQVAGFAPQPARHPAPDGVGALRRSGSAGPGERRGSSERGGHMINLHVLLADDEPDIRDVMAISLERDPFFVLRSCASGGEALATAIEWRPDLTLLDVVMPGMDGPTVLSRLRADKRTAPIPVVFVTARAQACERERFTALGAAGVIAKPFDPMALAATVRRFVPFDGALSPVRHDFLQRLEADAGALAACRPWLSQTHSKAALLRIGAIAHALAGAGGIYGFAGITCESAALSDAAEDNLAGRAGCIDVEQAIDRLLRRIRPLRMPARGTAAG